MPQSIQPERSQICNELLSQKQRITLNTTIINYKVIKLIYRKDTMNLT